MRLFHFRVNSAWAFVFGNDIRTARPTRLHGFPLFFESRAQAVAAAESLNLIVGKTGIVSTTQGRTFENPISRRTAHRIASRVVGLAMNAAERRGLIANPSGRVVEYKTPAWGGGLSQHKGPWKCTECGRVCKTDKAARSHKFNTGHSSFKSTR